MKRWLSVLAVCAFATPGLAQPEPIYAPCLAADNLGGIAQAFAAAGWSTVADGDDSTRAMADMAQAVYAVLAPPEEFLDAEDASDYAMVAAGWFLNDTVEATSVFELNGVRAVVRRTEGTGDVAVQCHLSAPVFPEVDALLVNHGGRTGFGDGLFGSGLTSASFDLGVSEGAQIQNSATIIRLEGAPDALRHLAGSSGIFIIQYVPRTGG